VLNTPYKYGRQVQVVNLGRKSSQESRLKNRTHNFLNFKLLATTSTNVEKKSSVQFLGSIESITFARTAKVTLNNYISEKHPDIVKTFSELVYRSNGWMVRLA
jgi:hypothetical protein